MGTNTRTTGAAAGAVSTLAAGLNAGDRAAADRARQAAQQAIDTSAVIQSLEASTAADLADAVERGVEAWNALRPESMRLFKNDVEVGAILFDGCQSSCAFSLLATDQRVVVRRLTHRGRSSNEFSLVVAGETLRIRAGADLSVAEFVEGELVAWLQDVARNAR